MRKLVVAGFLLILAGFVLYSQTTVQQPFVVQYVDGSVQLQIRGQTAWKTLKAKDQVPADATVKLAKGAMMEMSRDKTVLSLIKEGMYPMAGLLSKVQASGTGLGSTVAQKIKSVSSDPVQSSTTGGVRAAQAGDKRDWSNGGYSLQQKLKDEKEKADLIAKKDMPKEGFEIDNLQFFYWGLKGGYAERENPRMYEEYKDAVDRGIRAMIDSQYDAAIENLRGAVTQAIFTEEIRRANYLLAVAYIDAGSPVRAWKIISGMNVVKDDLEYGDFLVRKAQLQVDSLQYEDALATVRPLLEPLAKDEFGQAACLVTYYADTGLNRNKEAADARQKGLGIQFFTEDENGKKVETQSETARILKSLE
jgi:Tfp pilus assembly protein PilZ